VRTIVGDPMGSDRGLLFYTIVESPGRALGKPNIKLANISELRQGCCSSKSLGESASGREYACHNELAFSSSRTL
jgi:hypothetical protein